MNSRVPLARLWAMAVCVVFVGCIIARGATEIDLVYSAAVESITTQKLQAHVDYLSSPQCDGREAGTPGGWAAAEYLRAELDKFGVEGAATDGRFDQPFGPRYRNIIGIIRGSDPRLRDQTVLICAHYDHVGHGTKENSKGPFGQIHPGADDNASGVAALLELAEAIKTLPQPPARSIVFAFWDAEEEEMLGSKHWVEQPSIPLGRISAVINVDMIGRLRENLLTVYGSRTAYGFRRMVSEQNEFSKLKIDFSWELEDDGDQYPFFQHGIPILFLHSGLHDDYHSPKDTPDKINTEGMRRVSQLLFHVTCQLAGEAGSPAFRIAATGESDKALRHDSAHNPFQLSVLQNDKPLRLGISWRNDDAEPDTVVLTQVAQNSIAAGAGLQTGDRVYKADGQSISGEDTFQRLLKDGKRKTMGLLVERDGLMLNISLPAQAD